MSELDAKDKHVGYSAQSVYDYAEATKNSKVNRAELRLQEKLRGFDKNLLESKQSVVRHVLQHRLIEKSKTQVLAVDRALLDHLRKKLSDQSESKYLQYLELLNSGRYELVMDKKALSAIERASATPHGLGQAMHDALYDFSDKDLNASLESFNAKPGRVNKTLFTRIVAAASHSRINYRDALQLYDTSLHLMRNGQEIRENQNRNRNQNQEASPPPSPDNKDKEAAEHQQKWLLLKSLLRKKLLFTHVTESVMAAEDKTGPKSSMPNHTAGSQAEGEEKSMDRARNVSPPSSPTSSFKFNSSSSSSSSSGKSLFRSETEKEIATKTQGVRQKLQHSLYLSQSKQEEHSSKISSSINAISMAKDINFDDNPNALMYAKRVYLEKLECIYQKINQRAKVKIWNVWKLQVRSDNTEFTAKGFFCAYSAYRLVNLFEFNVAKKLHRAMTKYKQVVELMQTNERLAAVVEIQRMWRAAVAKNFVRCLRIDILCTRIQCKIRARIAKRRVRGLRHLRMLKSSVLVIEGLWKANVWKRTLAKVFLINRRIRSARHIQRVFRGYEGRLVVWGIMYHQNCLKAALKFQCLVRRYNSVKKLIEKIYHRDRRNASIILQTLFRGAIARVMFKDKVRVNAMAKMVQYSWLVYKAKKEKKRRTWHRCAIHIQMIVRGRRARRRFARMLSQRQNYLVMRDSALASIRPIVIGFVTRRRWHDKIAHHIQRRAQAANIMKRQLTAYRLGYEARERTALMNVERTRRIKKKAAATEIQRRQRGIIGRKRASAQKIVVQKYEETRRRVPKYYVLKEAYFKDQNYFHKSKSIKIQCCIRRFTARRRVKRARLGKYAAVIQRNFLSYMRVKKAKAEVKARRVRVAKHSYSVVPCQRVIRGFLSRCQVKRHKKTGVILWFLKKLHSKMITAKALENFRVIKARKIVEFKATTLIQTLVRRVFKMNWFRKSLKKLTRQRNARIKERRRKASILIQTVLFRGVMAKIRVRKQRWLRDEAEKERIEYELIESSLDGMHDEWLVELAAIRLETGARGMLARKAFMERIEKAKEQSEWKEKQRSHVAAAVVQALVRGNKEREIYKQTLPALKKAKMARAMCVECASQMATKNCKQCKDKFCVDCFALIHKAGNRKTHSWENVRQDVRMQTSMAQTYGNNDVNLSRKADKTPAKSKKADWEEFYDDAAKAKYWFNKNSGEASWICPY